MSHISVIETKIKDLNFLKKALERFSIEYTESVGNTPLILFGYGKDELIQNCVMEIKTGCKYSLGLRKVGEHLEEKGEWMVGTARDWSAGTGDIYSAGQERRVCSWLHP